MGDILLEIQILTSNIKTELIQKLLIRAHKNSNENQEYWNQILDVLWKHLQSGLDKFEDQLLCATCFYTVLSHTDRQDFYLSNILRIINKEIYLKENNCDDNSETLQAVSFMYGLFQSALLIKSKNDIGNSNITNVLKAIFCLLTLMAYEYTQYTFTVFKTITFFKKVCDSELQIILFSEENQVRLLNLVNQNWENPITGVRDMNKIIFQTLLSVIDEPMADSLINDISNFYWNKAKYLMLAEITKPYKKEITTLLNNKDWIEGLIYSLYKPGLVSAGADMYYAILQNTKSEDEWCEIFLSGITKILKSSSYKAIDNFNNYWCLATLKKYPHVVNILIRELKDVHYSQQTLYVVLNVMKQGNKLGLFDKKWKDDCKYTEETVVEGIEHYIPNIRMSAFEIVCVSNSKCMPSILEYNLVLNFLYNNVNSDSTVLRINMLSNLNNFLTRLHKLILNNMTNLNTDRENVEIFCLNLQKFVVASLDVNGNYQRKITTLKVFNIILTNFKEIPKKNKNQTRKSNITLMNFLIENNNFILFGEDLIRKLLNLLKDPADDIRETVNLLLINHYSDKLRPTVFMNCLIEDALQCIRSKFFFQISCGQSMFKLIVKSLSQEKHEEAIFKSVDEIFAFTYNELISECKIKRNIVDSIENGKQLHSFLSILIAILETCCQNSYQIRISKDIMFNLLHALEYISKQFFWEQETSTSSDFSKMSDMVQNIIINSGFKMNKGNEDMKISGLHQLVLNCIWLNVKASCELSSILIRYHKDNLDIDTCERCLNIITGVLETSRHKGAIEAAGVALGCVIQCLTSLPDKSKLSKLPYDLLTSKLQDMILETNKMASVTRRGAGLSIMVHKIVSNDMKKNKPLFHHFMKMLLETFKHIEDIPNNLHNITDLDNEKDLPKAIYIHFLTRIVTDSSLASDMMYYSAKLAELAFDNLINPHWQIRNAALQLYGALVPKLIGQKKAAGTDDESVATVALDEFRTHSPKLWNNIVYQLGNKSYTDELQFHSNLVPILNILANSAKRYNYLHVYKEPKNMDTDLLRNLVLLLGSPIYTVRRLAAKSIYNIYTFEQIYDVLIRHNDVSENYLHGSLFLIQNCVKSHLHCDAHEEYFISLKEKVINILIIGEHSYICKMLFEEIFTNTDINIEDTLVELNNRTHVPGIFAWANARIRKYLKNAAWSDVPKVLKILLNCSDFEEHCKILYEKLECSDSIPKIVLIEIANILLLFNKQFESTMVWKILYQISLKVQMNDIVDLNNITKYIEANGVSYKLKYMIAFVARLCANIALEEILNLSKIIFSLCDSETTDVDMRYIAALANNELANSIYQLSDEVKTIAIKSAVILLQDEDEDVRNLAIYFYANIKKENSFPSPYICLHKIMDRNFLGGILSDPENVIPVFCTELEEILDNNMICTKVDKYNPFANDSKNIYFEVKVMMDLIGNLKNV